MPRRPEDTFSFDELAAWDEPGTHLAVLGHPVKHSLSPQMHNAALAEMARSDPRFASWRYWKFDVAPELLGEALALLRAKGFRGVNLTVPHKVLALAAVARVDPAARDIGAVNTLCATPDGFEGFNTDGHGLAAGIEADLGSRLAGVDVVLLGAGWAARGAAVECLRRRCRSLWIGNRSPAPLARLLVLVRPLAAGIPVQGFPSSQLPPGLPEGALVINATSAGLKPADPPPVDLRTWPRPAAVYDTIYNPPRTPLLADAERLGIPCANGLSMLVHQGARALELWTGTTVPARTMHRAAAAALAPSP